MNANEIQHGGKHYKNSEGTQHWDWVTANFGLGYLAGCATKYVSRWRNKNGLEDLKKAEHYVQKMIEFAEQGETNPALVTSPAMQLVEAYDLTGLEHSVCDLILRWENVEHLKTALIGIQNLQSLAEQQKEETPEPAKETVLDVGGLSVEDIRKSVAERFRVPLEQVELVHVQADEPDGMEYPFGYDPEEEGFEVVDDEDLDFLDPKPLFRSKRETVGEVSVEETEADTGFNIITVEGNLIINL